VNIIFNYTGWKWEEVFFGEDKKSNYRPYKEKSLKRGIFFYILFHNGVSYRKMSQIFKLDHTSILISVRKFNEELEKDMYIRKLFKEVVENIKENYYHISESFKNKNSNLELK